MGENMNYPENPIDFIKQYSFSDKQRVYTNGSELISVFRVGQMIGHYMSDLTPQQIKDMQFCLREKSRECAELRRELQEIKNQKNDRWIPVEERFPDKEGAYLVTYQRDKKCEEYDLPKTDVCIDYFRGGIWFNNYFCRDRNIAWRPLPEPYKPKQPETCKYTGGSCCWPIDQCSDCPNNPERGE